MTLKPGLPMLALALNACSSAGERPQPLAAVPEQRVCPALAQPPAKLVAPPKKLDFLPPTPSSPPSKPSSSTN